MCVSVPIVHINAGDCWKHIVVRRPRDLKIPSRPKSLLHPNAGDAVVRMVIHTPEDVPALAFRRALDAPKACALQSASRRRKTALIAAP